MVRRLTAILIAFEFALWPHADAARVLASTSEAPVAELGVQAEPLVIVVNRSNPSDNLSSTELRNIFLGSRSHWTNGRRITLVMRDPGEPERRTILRDVCNMTEDQMKTHFLRGLFTGEILVSPKVLSTPLGVRRFIFNVPGAIGYLRLRDVDDSVKILRIDDVLPDDKHYRLRILNQVANE
jgi:ABC-type phosphate transport system substrate-binding protein